MKNEESASPAPLPIKESSMRLRDKNLRVLSGGMPIYEDDKVEADIFFTAYFLNSRSKKSVRPLTFVFNGGPGASSAYLHIGAMGPRRLEFEVDGGMSAPPPRLTSNQESWIEWTDLIFVDPVGTGFSRMRERPESSEDKKEASDSSSKSSKDRKGKYWKLNKDIDSLCDFMSQVLSREERWSSAVYIAGESYGGFRVAKLAKRIQEKSNIALAGSVLISPALEIDLLSPTDYNNLPFVDAFPSIAASAYYLKKVHSKHVKKNLSNFLEEVEGFAMCDYASSLLQGELMSDKERERIKKQISEFSGLSESFVEKKHSRIRISDFTRELCREDRKAIGLYDATQLTEDPFADRNNYEGPDPTLRSIDGWYGMGINQLLREELKVKTNRDYILLNMEANNAWEIDEKRHALETSLGATDDLRFAMSQSPHMKVWICHGLHDLVTPYFSSKRIIHLMQLKDRSRIRFDTYMGGHMFYAWQQSRKDFARDARKFYQSE